MKSNRTSGNSILKHISQKKNNKSVHTVRCIIDDTALIMTIKPLHDLPEHLCFDELNPVKSSIVYELHYL